MTNEYKMTISWLTVDKLGIKLYDKVSAVIAELVSNSYDADATEVRIEAPLGRYLTTKADKGDDPKYEIKVIDNGMGMAPDEINECYLRVGAERRIEEGRNRGNISPKYGRSVMGCKGVGKLAPFGICEEIEILTSGGEPDSEGYLTAHFILNRRDILSNDQTQSNDYQPKTGEYDGTRREEPGTTITLRKFAYRKVSDYSVFSRQLSQRFGLHSADWNITIRDTTKNPSENDYEQVLDPFSIEILDHTKLKFEGPKGPNFSDSNPLDFNASEPDGTKSKLEAGFYHDEKLFPITGWVAYSKEPYKDDLMAGIRIYCRGKLAAQTSVFNREAGFHREHSIKSYLVGELHADWLDEGEDLILTDRRDILWSHDICQSFKEWGGKLIKQIGDIARDPMRKKIYEIFMDTGNVIEKINNEFPAPDQENIRYNANQLAQLLGQSMSTSEAKKIDAVKPLVDISLTLAPHMSLDESLKLAANEKETPVAFIAKILKKARIADLSSFGRIAEERLNVIERLECLKDDPNTAESLLQDLLEEAPWLINPQWAPISSNETFSTLRREFEKYYEKHTGNSIHLEPFSESNRRPDFVLSNLDKGLHIIEIKRPNHKLTNQEMDRVVTYYNTLDKFLKDPGHLEFRKMFENLKITIVCDGINLSGSPENSFILYEQGGLLERINWSGFLLRTRRMHNDFLEESKRQKRRVSDQNE